MADSGRFPFGLKIEFLGGLGNGSGSGTSQNWKGELGAGKSGQWIDDSWEFTIWAINEDSSVINEVNDDNKLTVIFTVVDETNSSWLDEISETLKITMEG